VFKGEIRYVHISIKEEELTILTEWFLLILGLLLFGIIWGMTFCNLTCGPLLILRLGGEAKGAKEGFLLSILFSLPRIVLLTSLGVVVGALGYGSALITGIGSLPFFNIFIYTLISIIMIATGLRFLKGSERPSCQITRKRPVRDRLERLIISLGPRRGGRERISIFGIGMLVSVLCLAEGTTISLLVSTALGIESSALESGALLGGLGMLAFSTGLTIPLVILGTGASFIGNRMKKDDVRKVAGVLLVVFGCLLLFLEIVSLISLR